MSLEHAINLQQNAGVLSANELKSLKAGKAFLVQYALLTVALFGAAFFAYSNFAWAHTNALWFGILLCTSTSFVSFMLTEWAYHQPTGIFLMVSMGSVVVRLFNLAIAFGLGQFFLGFNPMALAASLLVSYFSYFVIEVLYIHNKALTDGQ